jgi:murein DD-endopeptidase MepM/ murein hydrolase activator NlpD
MRGPRALSVVASVSTPATLVQVAAAFVNAPYLNDLLGVLEHPVSAQPPDLRHFRAISLLLAQQPARHASPDLPRPSAPNLEVFSLGAFWLALGGCAILAMVWRGRGWRHNAGAALGLLLFPAVISASITMPPAPTQRTGPDPNRLAATVPGRYQDLVRARPATWVHLLTIEKDVAGGQDKIALQERQIAEVADAVVSHARNERPSTDRLPLLLGQHRASQDALVASLKQEYEFYRALAQEPEERDRLLTAASVAPEAAALDAVTYNLSLVQAQLTQEAAIQAAEAKLAAIGSLSTSQLGALRQRQPFIVPVVAPVVQGFGPSDFSLEPPLTFGGTFYPHFPRGIDLAAPVDSPIHAAADGVVLLATATTDGNGHLVGYGNYVVIAHPDGFVTLYGHLNSTAVHEGQVVHQGEIIGQEGSTGLSTGPHLHFEIRHNGVFLDPALYLASQLG